MYDFAVIGGGILGLATAHELQRRYPGCRLLLVEKERELARHQSGHNSGVIHAGVYYAPGSLKARFCREGNRATRDFCDAEGISYQICGKLLVATEESEIDGLEQLASRCDANAIPYERLNAGELREREPAVEGLRALFVPSTGIVSYGAICRRLGERIREAGGELLLGQGVEALSEQESHVELQLPGRRLQARRLVACAGLHSDRLVAMLGQTPGFRILPFRGEYYRLASRRSRIVNHLIYPVPDPELPFLGVHLTRMIDGSVTVGPNAVLALAREGYRWSDVDLGEIAGMLGYPGLRRLLGRYPRATLCELRDSLSRRGYLKRVQRYCPQLTLADLQPCPAGVRAQAVTPDGKPVDDFLFVRGEHSLVVCNAPSPAATSAFPIARHIVDNLLGTADTAGV